MTMQLARHSDPRLTARSTPITRRCHPPSMVDRLPCFLSDAKYTHMDTHETVSQRGKRCQQPDAGIDADESSQVLSAQEKRRAEARLVTPGHEGAQQWSRGDSNPRPVIVSKLPLHA